MHNIINRLKNLFTAMAYAEAGDLDAVKQILRENSNKATTEKGAAAKPAQQPAIPAI